MSSAIQNILDNVIGDGARSTKFECVISFPGSDLFEGQNDIYAMVKTSQFPGKKHETIDLLYKGRTIPIKSQTNYDNTWSCTFYLTQDHRLKMAFENWIESIDQKHNIKEDNEAVINTKSYMKDNGYTLNMLIAQKDFSGNDDTCVYELFNCFPKSVSTVDVDYSAIGAITEFTVEFSYVYFTSEIVKIHGSHIDAIQNKILNTVRDAARDAAKDAVHTISDNLFPSSYVSPTTGKYIKILNEDYGDVHTMITQEIW